MLLEVRSPGLGGRRGYFGGTEMVDGSRNRRCRRRTTDGGVVVVAEDEQTEEAGVRQ